MGLRQLLSESTLDRHFAAEFTSIGVMSFVGLMNSPSR